MKKLLEKIVSFFIGKKIKPVEQKKETLTKKKGSSSKKSS